MLRPLMSVVAVPVCVEVITAPPAAAVVVPTEVVVMVTTPVGGSDRTVIAAPGSGFPSAPKGVPAAFAPQGYHEVAPGATVVIFWLY